MGTSPVARLFLLLSLSLSATTTVLDLAATAIKHTLTHTGALSFFLCYNEVERERERESKTCDAHFTAPDKQ